MIKTEVTKKLAASLKEAGITVTEEIKYFVITAGNEPAPAPKPKRKKKRKEQWYSDTEVLIMPKIRKVAAEKSTSIVNVLARNLLDYVDQSHITLGDIRANASTHLKFTHKQLTGPINTLRERGCLREVAK
tara:strand:+ start:1713 stop:2105 length:393 start_codon:yes stop_codon:yes gene_type:complete